VGDVHKGDLLVELDTEPFQNAVKRPAVDTAKADRREATAMARGIEADAMSRRWKLQHAMEDVDNQVSLLRARVAGVDKSKAALTLAEVEFDRVRRLEESPAFNREVYDQRQAALLTARAGVTQALADVYQIRVSLGLPAQPEGGEISAKCRPISIKRFLPSSKRRRT
jgi:membrane fusion protein (multidrug efflux system)